MVDQKHNTGDSMALDLSTFLKNLDDGHYEAGIGARRAVARVGGMSDADRVKASKAVDELFGPSPAAGGNKSAKKATKVPTKKSAKKKATSASEAPAKKSAAKKVTKKSVKASRKTAAMDDGTTGRMGLASSMIQNMSVAVTIFEKAASLGATVEPSDVQRANDVISRAVSIFTELTIDAADIA